MRPPELWPIRYEGCCPETGSGANRISMVARCRDWRNILSITTSAFVKQKVTTRLRPRGEGLSRAPVFWAFISTLDRSSPRNTIELGTKRNAVQLSFLAWPDYSFFSIVTLTTIGYGDVVPIGSVKGLVMMEGIIGAMYPPILIGRLLTLHARSDGSRV